MKDRIISKHTVLNPIIRDDPGLNEIVTKVLTDALAEHEEMMETVLKRRMEKEAKAAAPVAAAPSDTSAPAESDPADKETIQKQQQEIDSLLKRISNLEKASAAQEIPEDASEQEKIITNLRSKVQRQRDEIKIWKKESNEWESKCKDMMRTGSTGSQESTETGENSSSSSDKSEDSGDQEKLINNLRAKINRQRDEIKVWKKESNEWEDKCKTIMREGVASSDNSGNSESSDSDTIADSTPDSVSTAVTLDDLVKNNL